MAKVKRVKQRQTRKFNGVPYRTSGLVYTKSNATKQAREFRRLGTTARVVRAGKKNEYQVWHGPQIKK